MPRGLAGAAAGKVSLCSGLVFSPTGEEGVRQFGPLLQWKNDSRFTKGYCRLVPEALQVFVSWLWGSKWKCERSGHGGFFAFWFGFFFCSWGPSCSFSLENGKFCFSGRWVHTPSFEITLVKEATSVSLGGGWAEGQERCVPLQGNVYISRLE